MKQIGIVLLLTALAALGFVLVRVLEKPAAPGGVGQAGATAGQAGGPRAPAPKPQQAVIHAPERPKLDWKSMQTSEAIVPLEDAWRFDLSGVDLDAPVLCTVGGVEITRDEFRAYVCLTEASPLVEARLTWLHAKSETERRGGTIGLSDNAFEIMLGQWAEARGLDRDAALYAQSISVRLSVPATAQMRRWSQEALLAYFQHATVYEQLPPAMRVLLEGTAASKDFGPILRLLQEAQLDLEDPENLRKLGGALDALALFWGDARRAESVQRTTSCMDDVLPKGVVATQYLGDLPSAVEPPWLLAGDVAQVTAEELWPLLGSELSRVAAEGRLRELIWYRVLQRELREKGHLAEPEPTWMAFWQEYRDGSKAVLDLGFLQVLLSGFPTLHHYRAFRRIQEGFFASQPEGWRDEAALREFADKNRFFVQQWNPQLEIALFPAQQPAPGGLLKVDWEASKRGAEAMAQEVAAGKDFSALREAQQRELLDRYREIVSEADSEALRKQFQLGKIELPLGELRNRLQERTFDEMIDCVSVVRSSVVELDVGEVSPPWRTRLGYALVRLNGAIVGGLEREFEDVELAARTYHQDFALQRWANGVLKSASFE